MDFDKLKDQLESVVGVSSIARNIRVLIVDPDTTALMLLATQLEQKHYIVTTTESPSAALSLLQERNGFYNIVLADYHMPEMPAFVFTRKVLGKYRTMPVLLMTTEVIVNVAVEAILRGVCFFYTKPLSDPDITHLWQHVVRATGKIPKPKNDSYFLDIPRNGNLNSGGSSSGAQYGKHCNLKSNSPVKVNQGKGKNHVSEDLSDSNESDEDKENNKRPRLCWSPSLHAKFVEAIETLGEKAFPKTLLEVMNEPGLTHRQVASHLQKYRKKKKNQASAQAVENQALPPIKLPTPALNKVSQGQILLPRVNYRTVPKTPSWLNGSGSVCYSLENVKQKLDALDNSVNNPLIYSRGVQVQVSQGIGAGCQVAQGNGVGAELAQGSNRNNENSNADGDQVPWFPKTFSHIAVAGDNVIVHLNPNQQQAQEFPSNSSQVTVTGVNAIPYTNQHGQQATGFPQNFGQATMTGYNVVSSSNPNGEQVVGSPQNFGKETMTCDNVIPYSNPNEEKAEGINQNHENSNEDGDQDPCFSDTYSHIAMAVDNVIVHPDPNQEQAQDFSPNIDQLIDALDYSVNNAFINSGGVQLQLSQGSGAGGQLAHGNRVGAELSQGVKKNHEISNADGDQVPWLPQTFSHIAMTGDNVIVHPNPNQEQAPEFSLNFNQMIDALDYSVNNALTNSEGVQVQLSQGSEAGGQLAEGNGVGAELPQDVNQNHENSNADGDQVPWFSQTFSHMVLTGDNVIVCSNPNQQQAPDFSPNFNQVTVTGDNAIPYSNPNRQQATWFPQNFGQAPMTGDNVIPSSNPNGEQAAGFPHNFGQETMTGDNMIPFSNPNGEKVTGFAQNSGQVTMATTSMDPTGNQLINGSYILNQGPASDFGMGLSAFGNAETFGNLGERTMGANQPADNASEGMACNYDFGYFNHIIQDFDAAGGVDHWDPFN